MKDCKDLHDGSKYRGTKTHTLRIKKVEKSDKGSYQCHVKNNGGEESSEDAYLAVSKLFCGSAQFGLVTWVLVYISS